ATFFGEVLLQGHCAAINAHPVIFRMSQAYGAPKSTHIHTWHPLFNDLCRNGLEKGEITLNAPPDTQLDMIWLGDASQVIPQAVAHTTIDGTFNLGFGKSITTGEVAQAIAQAYHEYTGKQAAITQPALAGYTQP